MAQSRHVRHGAPKPPNSEIVELIPALRAFARTFCRDINDADDLVQETLVKGLSHLHQFEAGTSMKSWLFTIMRNTFYTRVKIARREAPGAADCISARPAVSATQEWSARGLEIHNAIQQLPEQQREVMMLIGVLGMSYEETAAICNCAMGTVKSRLNRARLRLLAVLGERSSLSAVERTETSPGADDGRHISKF
ncbi:sigma-70 family RNA polymerase sigma factor [Chelativorans composti]|jgi:RNA polymerase sigma factor, sigma-70 family|uniref:RNA polymerase sigma factor n=1 Tax=Chelativorans composti TaxID=768533 RepID=A0ABW5DEB4_9HYPH